MKKTLLALSALALSLNINLGTTKPVNAGQCKQPLPFGGWTYVPCTAPAPRVNKRGPGKKVYYFRVYNVDKTDTISYYFEGKYYKLSPGYNRKHKTTSRSVQLKMDSTAGNNRYDSTYRSFDPNYSDIRIWRKGKYLRTRLIDD